MDKQKKEQGAAVEKQPNKKKAKVNHNRPKDWTTDSTDPKYAGNFAMVYSSLLRHENFKALSPLARLLYITMIAACAGDREFHLTQGEAVEWGIPAGSFRRTIKQLINAGFIRIKESGYVRREANIYVFTNIWKVKKSSLKTGE